jgi:hypothetical protein
MHENMSAPTPREAGPSRVEPSKHVSKLFSVQERGLITPARNLENGRPSSWGKANIWRDAVAIFAIGP